MKLLATIFIFLCLHSAGQGNYWQQQVNYSINVTLNDKDHALTGMEEIEYINNSPDRLDFIWFHLWPNAYKNDGTAFAKQLMRDVEGVKRLKKMKDRGSIEGLSFTVDGQKARTEADPDNIDIVKLILPSTLQPGGKIKISTPFTVKIPTYASRSGHEGQHYIICQWYPKPAVYDRKGWHPIPYLDQGEFYGEFGNYNVSIGVPSKYIVGATGLLQNEDELDQYKAIGKKNVAEGSNKNTTAYTLPAAPVKTLNYKAENVHDFAWFADKDFVIRYDTLQLPSGKTVDVFTYHHPDGNANWIHSTDYVKSGARSYSAYIGEYAYPVVQAVEGPKNESSGGMEYPMITLITSPDATADYLDGVITHEVGHNWFYGMLASNERTHAWMDEGINTYFQFRYEAEHTRSNSIFGASLPAELKAKPVPEFQAAVYGGLNKIPMEPAIDIPATEFASKEEYGLVEYVKTSIWMYLMELQLGRDKLDKAIQSYFAQWKFKHPYPEDLQASMEKELNIGLSNYFNLLKKKGSF